MGESIRPSSFHNPTLSANKHVAQIYRSSLSAAVQTVQVSVEPRLSTALKDRSVVPYSSPKDSARLRYIYQSSNSVVFVQRQIRLRKDIRPPSKLFSMAEPLPFEKEININLVYSSCLKRANEMLLGDPRQAYQRTQSFPFPPDRHSSITRPCCSSTQAPCSLSLQTCTRALDWLRILLRTRRRAVDMHDHSRFQRDIEWRHRHLSLSLSLYYYSQKSLTHNIGSASALPIIQEQYNTANMVQHPISLFKEVSHCQLWPDVFNPFSWWISKMKHSCTTSKTHLHLDSVDGLLLLKVRMCLIIRSGQHFLDVFFSTCFQLAKESRK